MFVELKCKTACRTVSASFCCPYSIHNYSERLIPLMLTDAWMSPGVVCMWSTVPVWVLMAVR